MKTYLRITIAVVAFAALSPADQANAAAVSTAAEMSAEAFERLGRIWGRVPAKGASEALEAAIKVEGQAAVRAVEHGGVALSEAAARQGGEVFTCAARVPEAAAALARNAETLLPLARRFGDDVLRIEARAPGFGADAARLFGDNAAHLAELARMENGTLEKTLVFASHAPDAAAREVILKMALRQGESFLAQLPAGVARAGGLKMWHLGVAALVGAIVSHSPPELIHAIGSILGGLFGWLLSALGWALGGALGIWLACHLRLFSRVRAEWRRWKRAGHESETGNFPAQ